MPSSLAAAPGTMTASSCFPRTLLPGCIACGGASTPLPVDRPNQRIYWPQFLPDGRHFLYFERPEQPGTYVASLDSNDTKLIASGRSAAAYVSPGSVVFLDESQYSGAATLMAQPFDARRLQFTGEPSPVAERIASDSLYARGAFSASDNGTLVYARSEASVSQLTWFDRAGRQLTTLGPPAVYTQPVLSPDGQRVAVERMDREAETPDIWLIDATRSIPSRLTFAPALDIFGVWSPGGDHVVFATPRDSKPPNLFRTPSSGAGPDERLLTSMLVQHPGGAGADFR